MTPTRVDTDALPTDFPTAFALSLGVDISCELPSLFAADALEPHALSVEDLAELLSDSNAIGVTNTTANTSSTVVSGGSTSNSNAKRKLAGRRNSNKARDGRKAELAYLRKSVAELEARLQALRSSSRTVDLASTVVLDDESGALASLSFGSRDRYGRQFVPAKDRADSQNDHYDDALWREIARRQSDERTHAERENARLRLVLENQLKVAHSLERFLQLKAAATTTEIAKSVDVRRVLPHSAAPFAHSSTGFPSNESEAEIFQALLAGVAQSIDEIDAVFDANGLARAVKSGITTQMRVDPEAAGVAVEICATKELPFAVHETGAVVWNHYQFEKRQMPARFYSYYAHKSVDATDDTVVEDFTLELHAKNTRQCSRMRQMMRRSVSDDRYVIVWWSFFDPTELSDKRLSGMRFLERGYVMVRKSPSTTRPSTLLQLCVVITPHSAEGGMDDAVGAVTDFMLSSTAASVAAAHQVIENALMEQAAQKNRSERTGPRSRTHLQARSGDSDHLSVW